MDIDYNAVHIKLNAIGSAFDIYVEPVAELSITLHTAIESAVESVKRNDVTNRRIEQALTYFTSQQQPTVTDVALLAFQLAAEDIAMCNLKAKWGKNALNSVSLIICSQFE